MATKLKTSISCFRLPFIENETEKIFYVRTNWKVDPFKNLLGRDEKVVCELAVTDCKSFWTRNSMYFSSNNVYKGFFHNIRYFYFINSYLERSKKYQAG